MATKNRPMWLEKDGRRHLYAGDDVADARANGWKDPEGKRPNGEPYNPEPVEGERTQADAIEGVLKAVSDRDAKRAKSAKAEEPKLATAEKAPDLRVEVVETKAKGKK